MDELAIELVVEEIEARLGSATRELLVRHWRAHRDEAPPPPASELVDRASWQRLDSWRRRAIADPILGRRVEMLWRLATSALVESATAVGEAVAAILAGDQGFAALQRLFVARTRVARQLGYRDFFALGLELGELCEAALRPAASGIEAATRASWRKSGPARRGLELLPGWELSQLRTWLGLRLEGVRFDLAAGKGPARTYLVAPPGDVRVVLRAVGSAGDWRRLGHEIGHAAYASGHDQRLPWSLADSPSRYLHEAVAEIFADLVDSPLCWRAAGFAPGDCEVWEERRRQSRATWLRWQQVSLEFEQAGYREGAGDLKSLWRELVGRYLPATPPGEPPAIHLACDPCAQPSYLLAEEIRRRYWAAHDPPVTAADRARLVERLSSQLFQHGAKIGSRQLLAGLLPDSAV